MGMIWNLRAKRCMSPKSLRSLSQAYALKKLAHLPQGTSRSRVCNVRVREGGCGVRRARRQFSVGRLGQWHQTWSWGLNKTNVSVSSTGLWMLGIGIAKHPRFFLGQRGIHKYVNRTKLQLHQLLLNGRGFFFLISQMQKHYGSWELILQNNDKNHWKELFFSLFCWIIC